MEYDFDIPGNAYSVVSELQRAGFETYIVGGAIRDLLLQRKPKDFDISSSATPEEVRQVFGRRRARIIGKRFRLTHVTVNGELFEVSTFRRTPSAHAGDSNDEKFRKMPENMIVSDNSYGSSREDAFRRDFTINALFYDPVRRELIDHTGMGLQDIANRTVRAIGEPALRFEEDPVRMLRALKLVAQFDFSLHDATENALFDKLPLIRLVSSGRLSLELEKILKSSSSDRHLEVFFDYGLLNFFLPFFAERWGSAACKRALDLLYERNCRVDAEIYRDSISLALAAAALPFAAESLNCPAGKLWQKRTEQVDEVLYRTVTELFAPQILMVKVREAAVRIMHMQVLLEQAQDQDIPALMRHKSYPHARELMLIRHLASGEDVAALESRFPKAGTSFEPNYSSVGRRKKNSDGFKRRRHRRHKGKRPELPVDFSGEC
ncbi:MAG: CCA tRNA nucleotidyltransferase [Lentisphaerae bacterium]|nr:CCA tRNA nucleotidyltransferase [Lentisphaerota bacterium]